MIEWLKIWVNQIIVAVIIAVIFELILPNNKNKKYIKMMINLYVLFIILNPVISKITNQNFNIENIMNYDKYLSDSIQTSSTIDNNDIIESTYQNTLKENIKNKLEQEGYKVDNISIDINKDKDDEKYGSITKIIITTQNEKQTEESNIEIEDVKISSNNKINSKEKIKKSDSNKIKKILTEEYQIDEEKIEVY